MKMKMAALILQFLQITAYKFSKGKMKEEQIVRASIYHSKGLFLLAKKK
ncbi:MAG: hypothetical protein J7K95_01410 [Thermoplasmata archaeon]|nr:hypothetical protein [Thermoplasmata archaeon]